MFTPPITTGLKLLLEASNATISGSKVTGCTDSSGAGNNATTNGAPTQVASIFGSLPAIRLGSGSAADCLVGTFASWAGNTGLTLFVAVANWAGGNTSGGVAGVAASGSDDSAAGGDLTFYQQAASGSNNYVNVYSGSILANLWLPNGGAAGTLMGFAGDGTSWSVSANGTKVMGGSGPGIVTLANYCFGNRLLTTPNLSYSVKYDFGMSLVYNTRLTDANFATVGIAAAQYLSLLPSGMLFTREGR